MFYKYITLINNPRRAFGKPYKGDLNGGMNLGYTGKPYDTTTGLYNYGYRDYKPEVARCTTVDPIRDGANWFAYVNNDPVNYIDLLGLEDVYYYEESRSSTITLNENTVSEAYTYTHYSDDEKTLGQHREAQIAATASDQNFTQSKDNPSVFVNNKGPSTYSNAQSFGVITYDEIKEGILPENLPSPSKNNPVITLNGTAKDNKIGCGR